jgi:hypothetical protein
MIVSLLLFLIIFHHSSQHFAYFQLFAYFSSLTCSVRCCSLYLAHLILSHPTSHFLPLHSLLKDEMMKLRSAIDGNRSYEVPERHDPVYLMFDNSFHLGELLSALKLSF